MSRSYRFGEFVIVRAESRLERLGEGVPLQPKVFDALLLFAENPGQLLTKERLMAELWPDAIVGEEALTQIVSKLRQALGDDTRETRFLQTVMKRGYRFLPEVTVEDLALAAVRLPAVAAVATRPTSTPPIDAMPAHPDASTADAQREFDVFSVASFCSAVSSV